MSGPEPIKLTSARLEEWDLLDLLAAYRDGLLDPKHSTPEAQLKAFEMLLDEYERLSDSHVDTREDLETKEMELDDLRLSIEDDRLESIEQRGIILGLERALALLK